MLGPGSERQRGWRDQRSSSTHQKKGSVELKNLPFSSTEVGPIKRYYLTHLFSPLVIWYSCSNNKKGHIRKLATLLDFLIANSISKQSKSERKLNWGVAAKTWPGGTRSCTGMWGTAVLCLCTFHKVVWVCWVGGVTLSVCLLHSIKVDSLAFGNAHILLRIHRESFPKPFVTSYSSGFRDGTWCGWRGWGPECPVIQQQP